MERIVDGKVQVYETREVVLETKTFTDIDKELLKLQGILADWKNICDKRRLQLEEKIAKLTAQKALNKE